ncbi:MEDS domain-containing protein [Methanothermobacter marburgensis]|uniref:MEDS domain-containing protein n=1 Tax=Methanothermobacter marburgensis TaxID=145263 RepID=UPI0035B7C801
MRRLNSGDNVYKAFNLESTGYRAEWLSWLNHRDLRSLIRDMKQGDHLCLIYEDEDEWLGVMVPFIRAGLEAGERCMYITSEHDAPHVRSVLANDIPSLSEAEKSGQFIMVSASEVYTAGGVFDPQSMISFLESEVRNALADGFSGLRATGEMTWILKGAPGSERIIEYEALLNDFFSENECIAICQYHRPRFKADIIKGVLLTHPLVLWNHSIYINPYYIDPDTLLAGGGDEVEVENWLKNMDRENKLIRTLENLEYIYESFINHNPNIVFLKDSRLRYIVVNRNFCSFVGMEPDDIIGKTDYDILDEEVASSCHDSDLNALRNGVSHTEEVAHGRVYDVHKFAVDLPDGTRGVGGYAVNVTSKRLYEKELEMSRNNFMGVVEGSPGPIVIVNRNGEILYLNPAAEKYLSLTQGSIGRSLGVPLENSMQEIQVLSEDGSLKTAEMSVTPVTWEGEEALLIRIHDITRLREYERSLRKSLKEKEVMLREIHHRVKNNLQIISSLLNLQKYCIEDERAAEVFNDSVNRVKSMAMIHEKLYQSESLADLPFSDYIVDLVSEIRSNYPEKRISVSYDMEDIHLDINRAIPAGLIVNEAVTNAMKHAFKSEGKLIIRLFLREGMVHVEVEDDGPGLPADFDTDTGGSLGMDLMRNLAGQLDGELRISGDDGVLVSLVFPL